MRLLQEFGNIVMFSCNYLILSAEPDIIISAGSCVG